MRGLGLGILIAMMLAMQGLAQNPSISEDDLTITLSATYISKFRPNTWAPVDVVIANNREDFEGVVEVRPVLFSRGQAAVFSAPVQSDKGSTKRVRVHCYLGSVTSLEVLVTRNGRPVHNRAVTAKISAIPSSDLYGLVLDDSPDDFAFLHKVVQINEVGERGLHLVALNNDALHELPDTHASLKAFDFIICGDMDPERVELRQREAIVQYLQSGGTLIVASGENAANYRGSWLTDLAGVRFGSLDTYNEPDLAQAYFGDATGAREARQCLAAELEPVDDTVLVWGERAYFAAARPVGSGSIAVVAVDTAGRALQATPAFNQFWQLMLNRPDALSLNFGSSAAYFQNMLPNRLHISIPRRRTIALYLLLYFMIGVVANWTFWTIVKRREMAWFTLIFISAAFTAYAMMAGTAARAKNNEAMSINVYTKPRDTATTERHGFMAILAAKRTRLTVTMPESRGLARDLELVTNSFQGLPFRSMSSQAMRPFELYQSQQPEIRNVDVPAGYLRFLHLQYDGPAYGGFDGKFTLDEEGLHGAVADNTGAPIPNAFAVVDGSIYSLAKEGEVWEAGGQASHDPGIVLSSSMEFADVASTFLTRLFTYVDAPSNLDPLAGPCIVALLDEAALQDSPAFAPPLRTRFAFSALIAPIDVERVGSPRPAAFPLPVHTTAGLTSDYYYDPFLSTPMTFSLSGTEALVDISISPELLLRNIESIEVQFDWDTWGDSDLILVPEGEPRTWHKEHRAPELIETGQNLRNHEAYRIDNWRAYYKQDTGGLRLVVKNSEDKDDYLYGQVLVRARAMVRTDLQNEGGWRPWQSSKSAD